MKSLFNFEELDINKIKGLLYHPNFITEQQELALIAQIDQQPWMTNLKRRVQHYGYEYDYNIRNIGSKYLGELPSWLQTLCEQLQTSGIFNSELNQVIINEYMAGQGISPHIDCIPCFGDTICSLSLGSECVIDFIKDEKIPILLERRSLISITDEARFLWKHGIAGRLTDSFQGRKISRTRRISLTFRTVK